MNTTNLRILLRNLVKNTSFTIVNILGLSVSLAVGLLIATYLHFEFNFDNQGPTADSTYRLLTTFKYPNSPETTNAMSAISMGPYLNRNCAEIEDNLRVRSSDENILCRSGHKEYTIGKVLQVDSSFFDFFNHTLLAGEPSSLFSKPLEFLR
jgi:putative ABC transport system permease protein